MESFKLADDAIFDIDAIWLSLLNSIVTELFKGFDKLDGIPTSGHRRADLTNKQVLFYKIFSYLVIYQPGTKPLQILGVLHGKRNVSRILKERLS